MTLQLTTRRLVIAGAAGLLCALYLADLTGMGLVSKDEPRYADIGRAMAHSGDWITPRLWGQPWFEKPALLYWMIGLGFRFGLGPELAPRLPIALTSLAFLAFFWWRLRLLWDERVAGYSTAILATTAGWLTYSHVAITDLPLAALFTMALLFALKPEKPSDRILAAVALALATLAKSLVPLVLFVPVLAVNYRELREWFRAAPLLAFSLVCLPWYILCTLRNGAEFPRVLLLEHTLGRFYSPALHHEHGSFYYLPVLLLLLFPWFPLLLLIRPNWRDRRELTLVAVTVFGFVFFSASLNKLVSYLLPLIPAICILMGVALSRSKRVRQIQILPIALLGAMPVAFRILPTALAHSLHANLIDFRSLAMWLAASALAGVILIAMLRGRAFAGAVLATAFAFLAFEARVLPAIDATVSARQTWLQSHPDCLRTDDAGFNLSLQYYAGRILPSCTVLDQTAAPGVR